jgi:hypothetical protein
MFVVLRPDVILDDALKTKINIAWGGRPADGIDVPKWRC